MQMPPTDPDTVFEDLVQDLPPETIAMAYEFHAFARARKIKTPQQLLRVVLLYCGLDQSLREGPPGLVVRDDEVLEVDRGLGRADRLEPGGVVLARIAQEQSPHIRSEARKVLVQAADAALRREGSR